MEQNEDRPILVGLIALIGVGLVVGLIVGVVALGGTRFLGLSGGGDGGGGGGAQARETLELPPLTRTALPTDPAFTLLPDPDAEEDDEPAEPEETETEEEGELTLQASNTTVGQMERIDLTGTYTGTESGVLSVERRIDGTWNALATNVSVSNGLFSTFIQLGVPGENLVRVVDPASGASSNEITIFIQ